MQLLTELGILGKVLLGRRSGSSASLPATMIELSNTTHFKSDLLFADANFLDSLSREIVFCRPQVGRGDLKQIAPRKICAKPQGILKSLRCLARAFCVCSFDVMNVAI